MADTRRLPGLDLFRGLLLIGGPLVHSTFIAPPAVAHAVIEGSGLFRMAAFFAISGFLGGTTYRPGWLRLRLVQVGVPALFGILILNRYQAYVGGKLLVVEIYWFLLALLAYMPIGALIGRHCRALTSLPALILVAVGAHGLGDLLFGAGTYAAEAVADLPFYLFGWGVAVDGTRHLRVAPALCLAVLGIVCHVPAGVTACLTWAILAIALRLRAAPVWAIPLAAAAYTIYMVHPLFIRLALHFIKAPGVVSFLAVASFALVGSYLVHALIVTRFAPARFLLNGRWSA